MTVGSSSVDGSKLDQAKRHILTDKQGIPLSAVISSASTNDIKAVTKMLLIIQLSKENLHHISQRKRGQIIIIIYALIERTTQKKYSSSAKNKRWVVERTNSWHNRFRKLFIRYERKMENYLGLVQLSSSIIIYRKIILA